MLRRRLGLRTDDLNELRVKPVPTWCTSRSHMAKAKAKLSRIRITINQSKLLHLKRRRRIWRMRVASCADLMMAKKCPNCKGKKSQPEQKTVNMVVSNSERGTSGYGNLPYVFSVF
jgi:hypothetical protein